MYGILWKYLLIFGFILWILLCVQEYYNKNVKHQNEFYKNNLEDNLSENQKCPPCLTFWKTLSMVLSLGALVYIKRTSNARKCLKTNILIPKNECITPDLYSEPQKNRKNFPAICGVALVQKKLENLEKNVQSLKERQYESSTSLTSSPGLVSGSPEFRKFLSKLTPVESSEDIKTPSKSFLISNSSENIIPDNNEKMISNINMSANTQDSSWSTISEAISEISDPKTGVVTVLSTQIINTPVITEILQARQNFTDISKTSINEKSLNSLNSMLSFINNDKIDFDDNSIVPGSNLVPSEKSSISSASIKSSHQLRYFPSFSSIEDDDLLLNTLD